MKAQVKILSPKFQMDFFLIVLCRWRAFYFSPQNTHTHTYTSPSSHKSLDVNHDRKLHSKCLPAVAPVKQNNSNQRTKDMTSVARDSGRWQLLSEKNCHYQRGDLGVEKYHLEGMKTQMKLVHHHQEQDQRQTFEWTSHRKCEQISKM